MDAAWRPRLCTFLLFLVGAKGIEPPSQNITVGWSFTSQMKTCENNREGISPTGWRQDVPTAAACQRLCDTASNCVAVDYVPAHELCTFYSEGCISPVHKDGGMSFHVDRRGTWVAIDEQRACEDNDEGINRTHHSDARLLSLAECQASCLRRANCIAVDYFSRSGSCNFYEEACNDPFTFAGGASSWRLELEKGSPGLTVSELKRAGEWKVISEEAGCARSGEAVKVTGEREANTLEECQSMCSRRSRCIAVDYSLRTGACKFFSEACVRPKDRDPGTSSHRLVRKGLKWHTIDEHRSCEENPEGIGVMSHRRGLSDLADCRDACARISDCVAFDFYRDTKECNLYKDACTKPRADRNGASSYRMERDDGPPVRALPSVAPNSGISISNEGRTKFGSFAGFSTL